MKKSKTFDKWQMKIYRISKKQAEEEAKMTKQPTCGERMVSLSNQSRTKTEWCEKDLKNMTGTMLLLRREAEQKSNMDYLMATAILTGKIDSRIVKWAEMIVDIYEKQHRA